MNNIESFLNEVIIVDTETTDIDVESAEIVEIASGKYNQTEWQIQEQLLGTVRPIPPEASAVHHISNRMVRGLPTFDKKLDHVGEMLNLSSTKYFVAHNADFDRQVLVSSYKKSFEPERFTDFEDKNKWICTWRLAKAVLGIDYENQKYGLGYLRYSLDLDVSDDIPAHRAAADVITCGKLLEKLVIIAFEENKIKNDKDLGEQIIDLCWKPAKVKTWPFGKHKGTKLEEVPTDYYAWALKNMDVFDEQNSKYDMDLSESVADVLESRL